MNAGRLARIAVLVLVGAFLGGIVGMFATDDWVYTLIWPTAMTAVIVLVSALGVRRRRSAAVAGSGGRIPGIRNPGAPAPAPVAVLNPEPTAVPATGSPEAPGPVLLNGMPVSSSGPRPGAMPAWASGLLSIAIILASAAVALIPSYPLIGWTVEGWTHGRGDGADPRTGTHQQDMIDAIAAVSGGHGFVSVTFYDGYVLAQAPTSPGAPTTDNYEWRYGRAFRVGPASGSVEGLFDGSRIDFDIVGQVTRAAMTDAGWGRYISYSPSVRLGVEGEPEISVSLTGDYYSAVYTYSIEGELLDRYGTGVD